MRISDVLNKKTRDIHRVRSEAKLRTFIRAFVDHNVGSLVVDDFFGAAIGLVTERSIIEALDRLGARAVDLTARDLMRTPVPTCRPDSTVRAAMGLMTSLHTRHLVVTDNLGMQHGIVSLGDLVKWRLQDAELENSVLRDMAVARNLARNSPAVISSP
jgi:CBS domain-containing protein